MWKRICEPWLIAFSVVGLIALMGIASYTNLFQEGKDHERSA